MFNFLFVLMAEPEDFTLLCPELNNEYFLKHRNSIEKMARQIMKTSPLVAQKAGEDEITFHRRILHIWNESLKRSENQFIWMKCNEKDCTDKGKYPPGLAKGMIEQNKLFFCPEHARAHLKKMRRDVFTDTVRRYL